MIKDISNRLLRDFAACLQASLQSEQPAAAGSAVPPEATAAAAATTTPAAPSRPAAPPQAGKPISGISLFFGILRDRLRRLFRRSGR